MWIIALHSMSVDSPIGVVAAVLGLHPPTHLVPLGIKTCRHPRGWQQAVFTAT
eukprot:COSAG05_NODE_150_length_16171_cov_64.740356_10_plen_53_part_00